MTEIPKVGYPLAGWAGLLDRAEKAQAKVAEQAATIERLTKALNAFAEAFKEPDGGDHRPLRKFAESVGIYADDLGRDRILLRIALAALRQETPK